MSEKKIELEDAILANVVCCDKLVIISPSFNEFRQVELRYLKCGEKVMEYGGISVWVFEAEKCGNIRILSAEGEVYFCVDGDKVVFNVAGDASIFRYDFEETKLFKKTWLNY